MNIFSKLIFMAGLASSGAFLNCYAQNNVPKIGDFTSVEPTGQSEVIVIPSTHTFQVLAKSGETSYTDGGGKVGSNNDFTAYIGKNGSSKKGTLSVNHETTPGGVSLFSLDLNNSTMLWDVEEVRKVDFSPVQGTIRNCSGGITPWGTVITSEENLTSGDADGDGYQDIGWQVEIDPVTGKIMDYNGDGIPDKLWGHGRLNHENIAVSADGAVTYQAEDGGSSCVFKFVAKTPGNLSEGTLYVLKMDILNATTGTWIEVPNHQATLNNLRSVAQSMGGTNWRNPEDIEFGPDGKMFFTSKGTGTIWRFKDNGSTVSELEPWVSNQEYLVEYEGGSRMESWGTGIDNLAFDYEGNCWAQQDGGRNNVWVIYPDHTPEKPSLKLFMTTPSRSESTGLTFTPDGKYGFLSIQHPGSGNTATIKDAAGNTVQFNKDVTIVFARKEVLGSKLVKENTIIPSQIIEAYPNPFDASTQIKVTMPEEAIASLEVHDMMGNIVSTLHSGSLSAGEHIFDFAPVVTNRNGIYLVRLVVNEQKATLVITEK